MKRLALATFALALSAGAAFAQSGSDAGGPLGEAGRRTGTDVWGTTGVEPGMPMTGPTVNQMTSGKGTYAGGYRGEAARAMGEPRSPADLPGEPDTTGTTLNQITSGKGGYAGGYRGEAARELGIPR